jgi:hypothetical protein
MKVASMKWLVLSFTLPKDPSRARVSVWRKLKRAGSVNIAQSMWVLPLSDRHIATFGEISKEIKACAGEAYTMEATFLDSLSDEDIKRTSVKARDDEYGEFLEECEEFCEDISHKIKKDKIKLSKMKGFEKDIKKLRELIKAIEARTFFEGARQNEAVAALRRCEDEYARYAKMTLAKHDD